MSNKKKIVIGAIVFVVIGAMVFVNLKKSRGKTIEVTSAEVKQGNITQVVSGSGMVQPETDVQISARISAEIMKLHVKEGDKVHKGQLLVELDSERFVAQFDQAKSNQKSAQASMKKARADFSRVKDLFDRKLSSQADLDAAEANLLLAESEVERASAYLKQADDDLAKTQLISPMDGAVTQLLKEEGEIALGSQFQADVIMTVADLARMEILTEIDENDVVMVEIGDKANIEIDAVPDTVFAGVVSEIAHTATTRGRGTQEEVTNFEVKVAVRSSVEKLRPGMSATVDIETETHSDILHIPIQCVTVREPKQENNGEKDDTGEKKSDTGDEVEAEQFKDSAENEQSNSESQSKKKEKIIEVVFVINEGIAEMVPVETGISNDTDIEVLAGLEKDQQVVAGPYRILSQTLKDGSQVKVKKDETFSGSKND